MKPPFVTPWNEINRRDLLQNGLAAATALGCQPLWGQADSSASPRPQLGLNLAAVVYWTSERPFNNLFLTSSEHIPLKPEGSWNVGGELQLDDNGWIRGMEPKHLAAFIIGLTPGHTNTVYEVLYNGAPNAIAIMGGQGNTYTKSSAEDQILVRMYSPIRDVIVREKGFRFRDTFATRFLERCRGFDTLRFMDWQATNEDHPVEWKTRVTDKYYTQAQKGVALEHIVELCNKTSTAMWYCVHHRADDEYVRQAARFIKQQLTTGRPVYLEHSNEVWNDSFPQHKFSVEQNGDWLRYHIDRTAKVARLFRAEGVEVVSVLGLQSVNTWLANEALKRKLPEDINATAIAPYFSCDLGSDEGIKAVLDNGVDRVLTECRKSIQEIRMHIRTHRELAGKQGLRLLGYEGGQHLVANYPYRDNPKVNEVLIQANRHPEMYDLYRKYLQVWQQESDNDLMCLYNSVGMPSKHGSWGHLEYEGQPLDQAPKFRAVVDALS